MGEELLKAWLDGQLSKPVNNFEKARGTAHSSQSSWRTQQTVVHCLCQYIA